MSIHDLCGLGPWELTWFWGLPGAWDCDNQPSAEEGQEPTVAGLESRSMRAVLVLQWARSLGPSQLRRAMGGDQVLIWVSAGVHGDVRYSLHSPSPTERCLSP